MAKHKRTQRRPVTVADATESADWGRFRQASSAGRSPFRAATRPVAWSAVVSAAVLTIAVGPAHAAPGDTVGDATQVPNAGARPVPSGALQMPGGALAAAAPQLSSLAQQVTAAQTELESMGEQLKQVRDSRAEAMTKLAQADRDWRATTDRLKEAEQRAQDDAAAAYKATIGLPPAITSDLRNFGALSPGSKDDIPGVPAFRELRNAQEAERAKYQAYTEAIKAEQDLATEYLAKQAAYKQREQAYLTLRQQHAAELAKIEQEREAREQRLGEQYVGDGSLNGVAGKEAMDAVRKALAQLGKPYVWGAEGPDAFDCSGLVWYSYFYGAHRNLPRVAKDQYYGTRGQTVSRYALLPGDLIFFATNPNDWTTVHHVGIYLGGQKMIHAPHTGDVVKISTVWWSEFFSATRVVPALAGPPTGNGAVPPPATGGNPGTGQTGSQPPSTSNPPPSTSNPPSSPSPTPSSPSPTPSSPSPTPSSPSPTPSSPSPTPSSPSPTPSTSTPASGTSDTSESPSPAPSAAAAASGS
jgi:cell wall-associated NlpC family hydrolase